MIGRYRKNTLRYDEARCSGCGLCVIVCPHGVFAENGGAVRVARREACMECGACQRNCPTGAIEVESGVGCATALLYAALTGREACCGPRDEPCCGSAEAPGGVARSDTDHRTPRTCCGTGNNSPGRCCSGGASKEDE